MGNIILWRKQLDGGGNELLQRQLYQRINWKSGKRYTSQLSNERPQLWRNLETDYEIQN